MTISVVIQSDRLVTVTRTPSWLGKLLGEQERTREAKQTDLGYWYYTDVERFVEPAVERAIERALTQRAVMDRWERLVRK